MPLLFASAPIDWHWIWVVVAAFLAGVLNAVAGGGSFLSFPALLGTGILPVQANATNTVALWPGQLTSIAAYRDDIRKNMPPGHSHGHRRPAGRHRRGAGSAEHAADDFHAPGALAAADRRDHLCPQPAGLPLARPAQGRPPPPPGAYAARPPRRALVFLATMAVCFYIGYFGAGAGFLIITLLSLFGFEDLNEINALKVVSTTAANGIAFLIFVIGSQVSWRYCLLAMVACAIGGYTSARFARMIPQPVLRGIVIAIGFGMAGWYFWKTSH